MQRRHSYPMISYDPQTGSVNEQMRGWQRPLPFLRLPKNIRLRIYGYLFQAHKVRLEHGIKRKYRCPRHRELASPSICEASTSDSHKEFFRDALDEVDGREFYMDESREWSATSGQQMIKDMDIMRVCKVINKEAADILWSGVTITFPSQGSLPRAFFQQRLQGKMFIRRINLRLWLPDPKYHSSNQHREIA